MTIAAGLTALLLLARILLGCGARLCRCGLALRRNDLLLSHHQPSSYGVRQPRVSRLRFLVPFAPPASPVFAGAVSRFAGTTFFSAMAVSDLRDLRPATLA